MAIGEFTYVNDHEYLSEGGHSDDVDCNFDKDYVQCSSESSSEGDDEIHVADELEDYTLLDLEGDA